MAPTVPLKLSAESTIETTIELRWSAPTDVDGGIIGYFIERNLNDAGFATLVADTGNDTTSYTDTTLAARDNAKYRVSGISGLGTGDPSDTASATTSTSEAQTIKELLFNNWSLTGELSKSVVSNMTEVVNFLDRSQVPGNKKAKMIAVQKINELGNENIVEHPKFFEQSDTFEVTCFLQVPDSADDNFSVWIDLMQQMADEVSRILKTVYSPSTDTGEFFRTNTGWTRDNTFFPDEPMLVRTLRFVLTKLVGRTDETFEGYGGVLSFDVSASQGNDLPGTDFIYAEAYNVQSVYGQPQISEPITGTKIPAYYTGIFNGRFNCEMYLSSADIGTGTHLLNNIGKEFAGGEVAEVVFLQTNNNNNSETLTTTTKLKIISANQISSTEELVKFFLIGEIIDYPSMVVTT